MSIFSAMRYILCFFKPCFMSAFVSCYPCIKKGATIGQRRPSEMSPARLIALCFTPSTAGAQFHLGFVATACVPQLLVLSLGGPRPFGVTVIILTCAVAAPSCWLSPDLLKIPLVSRRIHQSSNYGCVPLVVDPQVLALAIP